MVLRISFLSTVFFLRWLTSVEWVLRTMNYETTVVDEAD